MSPRAQQLHETADRQIAELAARLSAAGQPGLARPCAGRERLGDGTVAAHTTDNYHRIGRFVSALGGAGEQHHAVQHGEEDRASDVELDVLLVRLLSARDALATIAQLSNEQMDSVPPAGEMKFADGERTLEHIIAGLLNHQRHQVDALAAALS